MNSEARVEALCVAAFARISASISHEIKNTLSIINEQAGLLEDLALMSGDDGAVPADRIKTASASIVRQVERSNRIMKELNKFAHSGDVPVSRIDIRETVDLAVSLAARQAAMKKLHVSVACQESLSCKTRPFIFEVLVYSALRRVYEEAPQDSELIVETGADHNGICLSIQRKGVAPAAQHSPVNLDEQLLAAHLGGTSYLGEASFRLTVPNLS